MSNFKKFKTAVKHERTIPSKIATIAFWGPIYAVDAIPSIPRKTK